MMDKFINNFIRMSLFQDEGVFDEITSFNIFTPGKCGEENDLGITPIVSKELSAILQDDDSGLGMENEIETFQNDDIWNSDGSEISFKTSFRRKIKSYSDTPVSSLGTAKSKRPLSDEDNVISSSKRPKHNAEKENVPPKLRKTLSFGDEPNKVGIIESVVDRLVEESELISDGSRFYTLPTINGKHQDIKNISPNTMVDVLQGQYDDVISDFTIIDCRYPYEYDGGHIKRALNLYTHEMINHFLQNGHLNTNNKTSVIIFHCEFSSERGPKLCRYLRAKDREMNSDNYPALTYPEIYLLNGGYKCFYESGYKNWCEPMAYKPMLHNQHSEDLRHFRSKSKSWTAGQRQHKRTQRLKF